MNVKKIRSRKALKLLGLLISSMLIASVSAVMYLQLTMTSTIQVYKSQVYFVVGDDNGTKGLVVTIDSTNTTATLTGLRAYPNASFTYTDPVRVRNNGSVATSVRLAPSSDPTGNAGDFFYVKFMLNATTAGDRKWLNYTSDGSSWTSPTAPTSWTTTGIDGNQEWPIVVYTKARPGATNGHSVTIGITVDVD